MAKKNLQIPKALKAAADLPPTHELPPTEDIGGTPDLGHTQDLAPASALGAVAKPMFAATPMVTGEAVLALARRHLGEPYLLGARAPMGTSSWKGPWDCAEFVSWCVYQSSGLLYGTEPRHDPILADAYTGFWALQAAAGGDMILVEQAAGIAGAVVLRKPRDGQTGHIVFSDGRGGTVEAHSKERGVIEHTLSGRRWDTGILVPGIRYFAAEMPVTLAPAPATVLRLTTPLTQGETVRKLQQRLIKLGFAAGAADGVYGPQTAHAVRLFQASRNLVADGEAGSATLQALKAKA